MDPDKPYYSERDKKKLRELGIIIEGEVYSDHESDADETSLESEEVQYSASDLAIFAHYGHFKTPPHKLGIFMEQSNSNAADLQINASQPNPIIQSGYKATNLPVFASQPNFNAPVVSGIADSPFCACHMCNQCNIPIGSGIANFPINASQPNINAPVVSGIANSPFGASHMCNHCNGSGIINFPMNASQPNINAPVVSGIANSPFCASHMCNQCNIPMGYGITNFPINASQPNINVPGESGIANSPFCASRMYSNNPMGSGITNLPINTSQPNTFIQSAYEPMHYPVFPSQPNLDTPGASRIENSPIGDSRYKYSHLLREFAFPDLPMDASQPNFISEYEMEPEEYEHEPEEYEDQPEEYEDEPEEYEDEPEEYEHEPEEYEHEPEEYETEPEEYDTANEQHMEELDDLVLPPGLESVVVNPIDITPDKSGELLKIIVKEGTGDEYPFPGHGDEVFIHYDSYILAKGQLLPLDSNRNRGCRKFLLGKGKVIKGWDVAIASMRKGESAYFIIDSSYTYGRYGVPPVIPPRSTLTFLIDLLDFKLEDLSPDKDSSILKKVLEKGTGSALPNYGSKMKIQLLGRYKGEVFEDSEKEFTLGDACPGVPEGIEMALPSFRLKEKSLILLKDGFGFPSGNQKHGIPPMSCVSYEVSLLSFERVKDIWEMNTDEKYEKAKISRERGIEFTKAKNFKVALKHFKWIVTCLEKEPGVDPQTVESRNSLLLSGYLNISLCLLKLENYKDVIKFCDKALKMQPNNEKALFRRGQAKMWNNDSEEAIQDFTTVSELYPENKAAKSYIRSCQQQIKKQAIKDKSVFNRMFEKFVKQDQERMKNMKTETGVWQNENGEGAEHHYLSETERLIEQNNSLLRDANIIELSSNLL